jgi:hypothetical protein
MVIAEGGKAGEEVSVGVSMSELTRKEVLWAGTTEAELRARTKVVNMVLDFMGSPEGVKRG